MHSSVLSKASGSEWFGGRDTNRFVFLKDPFGFYVEYESESGRVDREDSVLVH